jgi:hypothetical protein
VLAKSLLKGVPPEWQIHRKKIVSSLVAARDRAPDCWPEISAAIIRLINQIEPRNRARTIAFIAAFPDLWDPLDAPTKTALLETTSNTSADGFADYQLLAGVVFPPFRNFLLDLIRNLSVDQLRGAIAFEPLADHWRHAIAKYKRSGSYRDSEANFRGLILPFSGRLNSQQHDELLDAVTENGQNWDAADTPALLSALLRNSNDVNYPTADARNRFYWRNRRMQNVHYQAVFDFLQSDGWRFAVRDPEENN